MKNLLVALFVLTLSASSYACHMCYSPTSTLNLGKQHVCASCLNCYYAQTNPYLKKAIKTNSCQNTDCAGCPSCYSAVADIPSNLGELKIN